MRKTTGEVGSDGSHAGMHGRRSCSRRADAGRRRQRQLPEHGQLRALAGGLSQGGRRQRHLARHHLRRPRRHDHGPRHHLARPQAELLRPELHGVRGQADLAEPHPERRRQAQAASRPVRQGRAAVRRAGAGDRRLLGAGERLRRRHGRSARAALARHAGLRLPPPRDVPRRADGRAAHHRPRRPDALAR